MVYGGEVYPVTAIGTRAFADRGEFLKTVTIGKYVNSISGDSFENSSGLQSVKVKSGNAYFTVDAAGVLKDSSGNVVFDPNDAGQSAPPAPKEGCTLDIRESNGRYYIFAKRQYTVDEVLEKYGTASATVISASGEYLGSDETAGTGALFKIGDVRLYMVLPGDIDGNVEIDAYDYVMIKRCYYNTFNLNQGQLYAAAISNGESVTTIDYLLVKGHVMRTYDIYAQ